MENTSGPKREVSNNICDYKNSPTEKAHGGVSKRVETTGTKNESSSMNAYTFRVLPLLFGDKTKYKQIRELSLTNKEINDEWKDFLYHGPSALREKAQPIQERFWRWKMFRVYEPDDPNKDHRKKMSPGPKYQGPTRLPITGADLTLYRDYRKTKLTKSQPKK